MKRYRGCQQTGCKSVIFRKFLSQPNVYTTNEILRKVKLSLCVFDVN